MHQDAAVTGISRHPGTAGRNTIQPIADVVNLTLKSRAGQTANHIEGRSSANVLQWAISAAGAASFASALLAGIPAVSTAGLSPNAIPVASSSSVLSDSALSDTGSRLTLAARNVSLNATALSTEGMLYRNVPVGGAGSIAHAIESDIDVTGFNAFGTTYGVVITSAFTGTATPTGSYGTHSALYIAQVTQETGGETLSTLYGLRIAAYDPAFVATYQAINADGTIETSGSFVGYDISIGGGAWTVTNAGVMAGSGAWSTSSTMSAAGFLASGAAATPRDQFRMQTAGVDRFILRLDSTAESGSNAGSNFNLLARTDAGAVIDTPFSITRASGGSINLGGSSARPVTLTGALNVTGIQTNSARLTFDTNASGAVGSIWKSSGSGLVINGVAGSTYDFALLNNTSQPVLRIPIGTQTADFAGAVIANNTLDVTGGSLTVGTSTTTRAIIINGPAASNRTFSFQTAGVARWAWIVDNTAESGSNAGSKIFLRAFTDAGATIDSPIDIVRVSGGAMTLSRPSTFSSTLNVTGLQTNAGNLTFSTTEAEVNKSNNSGRLLLVSGTANNAANGAILRLEGADYGGSGLGGNATLTGPATTKLFTISMAVTVAGAASFNSTVTGNGNVWINSGNSFTSHSANALVQISRNGDAWISTTAFAGSPIIAGRRANGTFASQSAVVSGDNLLLINGHGHDATSINGTARARMEFNAIETWTSTANGTEILIITTPAASTSRATVATFRNAVITLAVPVSMSSTFSVTGTTTLSSLAGTGTRLVTSTSAGLLGNATTIAGAYTWSGAATFSSTISANNTITGSASGTGVASAFVAASTIASYAWNETDAGSDAKIWDVVANSETLAFRTRTDAGGTGASWLTVGRTATAITSIALAGPVSMTSTLAVTGVVTLSNQLELAAVSNGSPAANDLWHDSTQKALQFLPTGGLRQSLVGCIWTKTSNVNVSNTTTTTSLLDTGVGTKTIPANTLVAGKTIRIMLGGMFRWDGSSTLLFEVTFAGVQMAITPSIAPNSLAYHAWQMVFYITCRTAGASGTVYPSGIFFQSIGMGNEGFNYSVAPITVDTTANQTLDVTAKWSATGANNSVLAETGSIEILN